MDRERLKEVHATDLTESKVNEDFVDWLKSSGPTWLLVILVGLCVYLAVVRFKQHKQSYRAEAWAALQECTLPGSFEDVATEYGDVDQIANLARLQAAELLLNSIQSGLTLGAEVDVAEQSKITENALPAEEHDRYLTRADRLYQEIIDTDDDGPGLTLLIVSALNGKAAVAESRGDAAAAREWYGLAATRAEAVYPGLATAARERADSVDEIVRDVSFLPVAETTRISAEGAFETRRSVQLDEALEPLLLPGERDG